MNDQSKFFESDQSKFFESLAVAVAGGSTVRDASKVASCSESQAYRICSTAEFRQRVSAIRSEITSQAVGRLTDASVKAVDTIAELLNAANEPGIRLNAAKTILNALGPLSELAELRARIDALEQTGPSLRVAK